MSLDSDRKARHEKNVAKLKNLGMTDAEIKSFQNIWTNYINDDEYKKVVKQWEIRSAEIDSRTPDFLRDDPSFGALSPDLKEIAIYNYEIQQANDKQKAEALGKALEMATEQADPYWKNILLVAQDEVLRGFEQAEGDFESSVARQQRIMQNINEDLASNREFLTLEQQQDMTNLSRNYQVNQERLIEGAANAGLTFSTKRKIAEQRLSAENTGMVESSTRRYNKNIEDLQKAASRGTEEAQETISDMQRNIGDYRTNIGRSAEAYLGTENLPALPGYQPLGDITGGFYEDKVKDIETRKQALYGDLTQASLQY